MHRPYRQILTELRNDVCEILLCFGFRLPGSVVETKHWEVLGLQPGASSREVTMAYRTLSRQHHPDKAGNSEEANRVMGELAAANAAIQSSLDTDLEIGEFLD